MRIESKLCHLSENKAVVLVNGWLNDQNVGSALGEGSTVELAEDNAISRLNKRIQSLNNNEVTNSINEKNNMISAIEINSETDFVAKNKDFISFCKEISEINFNNKGDLDKTKSSIMKNSCPEELSII